MAPSPPIALGREVVWTATFLTNIAEPIGGDGWRVRGVVVEHKVYGDVTYLRVDWRDGREPKLVHPANVAPPLSARAQDLPLRPIRRKR